MPSHMPSSFASAAAGQAQNRDTRAGGRGESRGSGDWPRRETRGTNGTLTLRRSSTTPHGAPSNQTSQSDIVAPLSSLDATPGPSQQYQSHGLDPSGGGRYSKIDLLEIYRNQQNLEISNDDVSRLFANNWDPIHSNGNTARGWGKSTDSRDHHYGPEICWDQSGEVQPIGLEDISALEQTASLFSSDVNSPLKPPPQNAHKDGSTSAASTNGRKASLSHTQGGVSSFGLNSPQSSRPGTRRRETSDTFSHSSATPSGVGSSRFSRDEQSPIFSRKTTDSKDLFHGTSEERIDDPQTGNGVSKTASPFGSLMRSNTAGNALGSGPSSPWGATPASVTLSPMGNFGSFAMSGHPVQPPTPSEKRPGYGSLRGESRLAHLMPKASSEDISARAAESAKPQDSGRPWRSRPRTDTDPFGDEPLHNGTAALVAGQDDSSADHGTRLDTPARQIAHDFGMSDLPGFRDRRDHHQTPQGHRDGSNEPLSPTETNPYNSSPPDRNGGDADEGSIDHESMQHRSHALGGIPEHGPNNLGGLPRGFSGNAYEGSDRSQTSSVGASKGFPSLGSLSGIGGLGGLSGWPTSAHPIGTPDRERSGFQGAFGNSVFSPIGDPSPSVGGLGGVFGAGSSGNLSGSNTAGRGSKLGSLFPAAMQAQMHGSENESGVDVSQGGFGTVGRNAFGVGPSRETDSPMRAGRGAFDDLFQSSESRNQGSFSSAEGTIGNAAQYSQPSATAPNYQQSQASSDSASGLPQTQQRTMVMPDRMRWVYLDPQGQTQGPWSGLEMHDWYKASFFTADLSVKKVEDAEFEPLGQLIRRIGNSREPFLVPQIGVPHGLATTTPGAPFAPAAVSSGSAPAPSGSVQPPFAGAFPSFGTTLTAEQQNNLERRKQEEQYLMARQREFLAQQQVNMKQMQMQSGIPSSLHHHSSAHSLQSQPSFGSMASPIGMPPQGQLPGNPGFFESTRQPVPAGGIGLPPDYFREDELARLNLQERQQPFGPGMGVQAAQSQQLPSMFAQQQGLQRDQARSESLGQAEIKTSNPRLREFEQLRSQHDMEQSMQTPPSTGKDHISQLKQHPSSQSFQEAASRDVDEESGKKENEVLSLTEQVQKAASAKQTPAVQPESPWSKVGHGLPMPFPPPQSTTPLPAPMAQRGRSDLAEALNMGTRSRSETPDLTATTPSVAPWAKEPTEAPKGPSLKEIQEAEAKKAAKLEEAALAARRAAAEQESRIQPPVSIPAPGLPTSATWGNAGSPVTPSSTTSAWAKPAASKASIPSAAILHSKKTLADIQREEELRKQKLAAATPTTAAPGQAAGGKRYADLAGKPTTSPAAGGAWSTVGAGGKAKAPNTGTATATPSPSARAANAAVPVAGAAKPVRPVVVTARSTTAGNGLSAQGGVSAAHQEFTKWAKTALSKGLNADINVDNFVDLLSGFPAEASIVADSVYANSQLMDGRRFAEEFIRRRKLAEKGIVENANTGTGFSTVGEPKSTGGWSEVAKKGPSKEEPAAGFKVVPNKKKGRK
ncbi:MAG: hypothetical protein M1818_007738 [Claussenomyces sp. TS43310]|nr:MAG: hypothetical protein M1818_007738 [Claussenomyces sp. TS43310]